MFLLDRRRSAVRRYDCEVGAAVPAAAGSARVRSVGRAIGSEPEPLCSLESRTGPRAGLLVSTDAWSTRSCPRASPCGYVGRLTFWLPSARRARCSLPSTDARQHLRARPCGVSIKSPRSLRQLVAHFGAESGLCRRRAQAGGLGAGSAGGGSESRPSTLSPIRSCGQVTCGACKRSSAAGAVPHGAGDVSAVGTLSEPSAS